MTCLQVLEVVSGYGEGVLLQFHVWHDPGRFSHLIRTPTKFVEPASQCLKTNLNCQSQISYFKFAGSLRIVKEKLSFICKLLICFWPIKNRVWQPPKVPRPEIVIVVLNLGCALESLGRFFSMLLPGPPETWIQLVWVWPRHLTVQRAPWVMVVCSRGWDS